MIIAKINSNFVYNQALIRAAEAEAAVDRSPNASLEVMVANHFALLAAESFHQVARMAARAESVTMTQLDFARLTTPWKPRQ